MRFLVTGASGFIGQHLCEHLVACGHEVTATYSSVPGASNKHSAPSTRKAVQWIHVSRDPIGDYPWEAAFQDVEVVVHLAARAHVLKERQNDLDGVYYRANTQMTIAVGRLAMEHSAHRFIFLSSVGVNGNWTCGTPFSERDHPAPHDAYSRSKWETEKRLAKLFAGSNSELVIVRPPLVYGPGVKGNLRKLLDGIATGWPLPFGSVNNNRSFLGVSNLVDFLLRCAEHPAAAGRTFLVGDSATISTANLIRILSAGMGINCRLVSIPLPLLRAGAMVLGQTRRVNKICVDLEVDSTLARELLDWSAKTPIEDGLFDMACWYRQSVRVA